MFEKNFTACVSAGVPAISVVSSEWERIEDDVKYIAERLNIKTAKWTYTQGLEKEGKQVCDPSNPLVALDAIKEKEMEDTIIILNNFNPAMKHPAVIQKIREVLGYCKAAGNILVFISVSGEIPPELEKEILLVDYELPNRVAIEEVLHQLGELTESSPGCREKLIDAAIGLTQNEAENVIALALAKTNLTINETAIEEVKKQKAQALKKTGVLELYEPENLPKVGGLDVLKLWLWERGKAFSPEAKEFGLPYPKGILVFGIPGTGKSLIAKTIAKQWDTQLLVMGNILDKYVGESEKRMKQALKQAEAMAPCVLMVDEIEKFFAGVGGESDSGVSSRVFGQFLTFMQETKAPVFIVATANNIAILPPELLRKGRFDEIFFVDLPSEAERKEIFNIHIARKGRDVEKFDLDKLAKATPGYTGSEIEQIVISGLFRAFSRNKDIDTDTLLEVAQETAPLSITMEEQIKAMRDWGRQRARIASSVQEEPEKKISAFTAVRKIRGI